MANAPRQTEGVEAFIARGGAITPVAVGEYSEFSIEHCQRKMGHYHPTNSHDEQAFNLWRKRYRSALKRRRRHRG